MSGPWIIAFVALSAAVVILAAFVIGISQRIIPALERATSDFPAIHEHSGQDSFTDASVLPLGSDTPPLPLFDRAPTTSPNPGARSRLVVFMEAGCEPCVVLAADLRRKPLRQRDTELVAVVDDLRFGSQLRNEWSLVVDGAHQVSHEWRIRAKPQAVVTTADGTVLQTAVPNTRRDVTALLRQARRSVGPEAERIIE